MTVDRDAVWAALSGVFDPELDRPITELGFVASIRVSPVRVELRLPTYFCAPTFAWLMVADARDALAPMAGAVVLLDHFASAEINAAGSFDAAFHAACDRACDTASDAPCDTASDAPCDTPSGTACHTPSGTPSGTASDAASDAASDTACDTASASDGRDPDLALVRRTFERKAHLAAQERLAREVAPRLPDRSALRTLTLDAAAELAPRAAAAVASRRARLGIASVYALCDDSGEPLSPATLPGWLRFARTVRVSIDGNAGFCRGLLETRYGLARG